MHPIPLLCPSYPFQPCRWSHCFHWKLFQQKRVSSAWSRSMSRPFVFFLTSRIKQPWIPTNLTHTSSLIDQSMSFAREQWGRGVCRFDLFGGASQWTWTRQERGASGPSPISRALRVLQFSQTRMRTTTSRWARSTSWTIFLGAVGCNSVLGLPRKNTGWR